MLISERAEYIVKWIKNYAESVSFQPVSLIIGISGGVDSAVASTLAAKTGLKTIAVSMPIRQDSKQHDLSLRHLDWLNVNFANVTTKRTDITSPKIIRLKLSLAAPTTAITLSKLNVISANNTLNTL